MIEERAVIVALVPNSEPSLALLEVERQTPCGLCGQTRGCGNKIWGRLFRHQQGQFSARNTIGAEPGQRVMVAIDEQSVMYVALLLYFLPVVVMLMTAALANAFFASQLAALLGAVAGLLGAWFWIKGYLAGRPHGFSQPEIVRFATDACQKIDTNSLNRK